MSTAPVNAIPPASFQGMTELGLNGLPTLQAQVPMTAEDVTPYREILAGLGIAAGSKSAVELTKFLTQYAKEIKAIASTPQGRLMLAAAVIGGMAGYQGGKQLDSAKLKATAEGLGLILGSNVSVDKKTKAMFKLIANINSPLPESSPYNKDVVPQQKQSLVQSIADAKSALAETKRLPPDDTNSAILIAQTVRLKKLESMLLRQQPKPADAPVVNSGVSVPSTNASLKPTTPRFDTSSAQQRREREAVQAEVVRQKAAFVGGLQDQKGRDSVANKAMLVGWINSESPEQLKTRLLDITNIIKNPSGMGNVYGSHKFANGSKPRQATDPDFIQVQYGGGLYKISDLKYLATNLDNYLKKIDPAPSTTTRPPDVGTGLGQQNPALGIPLSPTDLRMLSEARNATAVLLKDYANAVPGSDAARDKQKLEELLSVIDTAMEARKVRTPSRSGPNPSPAWGDLLQAIKKFYTISNVGSNQFGGPPGPNKPDFKKFLITLGIIGFGGAVIANRLGSVGDVAKVAAVRPDFTYEDFDLDKHTKRRADLLNPKAVSELRKKIFEHYLDQAEAKIDSHEKNTTSLGKTYVRSQMVTDALLAVRSIVNPKVADVNFNPIASAAGALVSIADLGDSRQGQFLNQAIALINLKLAQLNSLIADTWSTQSSQSPMFGQEPPAAGLTRALAKQNYTEAEFAQVANSRDPDKIADLSKKTQIAIDTLVARKANLEKDVIAIRNFYLGPLGALGFDKAIDGITDYALGSMEKNNQSNGDLKGAVNLARQQIGFNPDFVNNLINTKQSEATALVKDIAILQSGLASLETAQAQLKATRTRDAVAQQNDVRIKPLELELRRLKDDLALRLATLQTLPGILDKRRIALGELSENIRKFEEARTSAEKIASGPVFVIGKAVSLSGQIETLNERLVISRDDELLLLSELGRIQALKGAITEADYEYSKASIERYVKNGVRVPLVAYPYNSTSGTTKVSGALTEKGAAEAIKSRVELLAIIAGQEGKALEVERQIRDIQFQIQRVSDSIADEQGKVGDVYRNDGPGSRQRIPVVPPVPVPGRQ